LTKRIIYDIGANNGDDIPYYLLKSDRVVAVEANPVLAQSINARFVDEVKAGRLAVENCVITSEGDCGPIDFYIHKSNHVLSQLPPPKPSEAERFEKTVLMSKSIADLLKDHGNPYYVKIDIEHYDALLLKALFKAGVVPPFISAESHSIEIFSLLVSEGHYNAFKLVAGATVAQDYADRNIISYGDGSLVRYSFPFHSAGPFGEDVEGDWMDADVFLKVLAFEGLGWKDIHATHVQDPNSAKFQGFSNYMLQFFQRKIKRKLSRILPRRHLFRGCDARRSVVAHGKGDGLALRARLDRNAVPCAKLESILKPS
jgi:FkbM family methyltransferase